jgi:hypothetical protein
MLESLKVEIVGGSIAGCSAPVCPPVLPTTHGFGFGAFGLALLGLGCTLWTQGGSREAATA